MDATQEIDSFFESYQNNFNKALIGHDDLEGTMSTFAEYFVGASPAGVLGAANNDEFRDAISKGNKFYRDIGTVSMKIDHIETAQLDSIHFMAKVFWRSAYNKNGELKSIDFFVIYLLQQRNDGFKIFTYITGDEQKILREQGILT